MSIAPGNPRTDVRNGRTDGRGGSPLLDISPVRYAHEQGGKKRRGVIEHGTENCYVNRRCRRPECREAHRRARARRALLNDRGLKLTVPAADVWPHVEQLMGQGWTATQIDRAVGLRHTVSHLRSGRPIHLRTAQKVLAVSGAPADGLIPAGLTMRRIQSLQRNGWTAAQIRQMAGFRGEDNFRNRKPYVYQSTATAIRNLYARLGDTPGPSKRASSLARSKGWPLPADWDDPGGLSWSPQPTTAPPEGPVVDPVAVDRWLRGDDSIRLTNEERTEAIRLSESYGVSHKSMTRRWGVSGSTFARYREGDYPDARRPQRKTPAA